MEDQNTLHEENTSMEEVDINSDDSIPGTSHLNDIMTDDT